MEAAKEMIDAAKEAGIPFIHAAYGFGQPDACEAAIRSLHELKAAAKQGLIDKHVYALGGMNIDNVRMAKDLGFGGVVICGDLWNRFDIHSEMDFKELIAHFSKLRKAVG